MPSLAAYKRDLDYSYAPGFFPAIEALENAPELVQRVLISEKAADSDGLRRIESLCAQYKIRIEAADKVLSRLSGKENCYAAAVFSKKQSALRNDLPHLVLQGKLYPHCADGHTEAGKQNWPEKNHVVPPGQENNPRAPEEGKLFPGGGGQGRVPAL